METYAYNYSLSKSYNISNCTQSDGRILIKDLFDMLAGTSTSGVIAAALSVPKNEHRNQTFTASEVLEFFKENMTDTYQF